MVLFLIHQSDDDCTNRVQNIEIKLEKLRTDMKTHFLPLSWEGIAVKSELNLDNAGANVGNCKNNSALHCISTCIYIIAHMWALYSSATADSSIPPLQTEVIAFMAAPRPADVLCRGSKVLLKMTSLIRKRKKRHPKPKTCQSLL